MANIETPVDQLPLHPDVRYEHTDINRRSVIVIAGAILAGTWIVIGLLYYFYASLIHYRAVAGPPLSQREAARPLQAPEPRIQASPATDEQSLRAYEDSQLNGYGWVDKQKGIVRIPIERAIQLTAQRGIPPLKTPLKVCADPSAQRQAGVGGIADPDTLCPPEAGSRETGFEGKVAPEPR